MTERGISPLFFIGVMNMKDSVKVLAQNLLTVKSIVTVVLTAVFSFLAVVGRITGDQFLNIFSVVIAFYFGTQYQKGTEKEMTEDEKI